MGEGDSTVRARLRRLKPSSIYHREQLVRFCFAQESEGKQPDLFIAQQKGCRAVYLLRRWCLDWPLTEGNRALRGKDVVSV